MRSSDLLTRCGFGPGGEGVWRGSSSDELEFLKKNIVNIIIFANTIVITNNNIHLSPGWWSLKSPSPLILGRLRPNRSLDDHSWKFENYYFTHCGDSSLALPLD